MARTLTYYVGASVDGFIAGPDGSLDRFEVTHDLIELIAAEYPETLPSSVRASMGLDRPGRRFDTVIQGRGTYALALEAGLTSPYAHLRQYVVSRTLGASPDPAVTVVSDDPVAAVAALKAEEDGLGIYLAGGGSLAGALADEIDELIVKTYPFVSGTGTPMFGGAEVPVGLRLTATRALDGGVVVSTYTRT